MNNQNYSRTLICSLILLLFCSLNVKGQAQVSYEGSNLELTVTGTSTLHDWHMTTSAATGLIRTIQKDGSIFIESAEVEFLAETLKSGKKAMDKNAYKALETDDNPKISFQLNSIELKNEFKGSVEGNLTVSGKSQKVTMDISLVVSGNQIVVTGSSDFKLTDFQVEPPKVLMGTIKTGNEVSIEFNTTFKTK